VCNNYYMSWNVVLAVSWTWRSWMSGWRRWQSCHERVAIFVPGSELYHLMSVLSNNLKQTSLRWLGKNCRQPWSMSTPPYTRQRNATMHFWIEEKPHELWARWRWSYLLCKCSMWRIYQPENLMLDRFKMNDMMTEEDMFMRCINRTSD
jgi:hypothetical protein